MITEWTEFEIYIQYFVSLKNYRLMLIESHLLFLYFHTKIHK
jgi:hypothetical protein